MPQHVVAKVGEIEPGTSKIVTVNGRDIGIFNVKGEYFALLNICPHEAAPLCRGRIVGVINLQNREPHEYTEREIKLISTIGFLVGAEIEMARLESENVHLSEKLETRKIVERAKGILQRELKITEEEAYLTIQRQSRQRRKSMKEVAEAIVLSEDVKRGLSD